MSPGPPDSVTLKRMRASFHQFISPHPPLRLYLPFLFVFVFPSPSPVHAVQALNMTDGTRSSSSLPSLVPLTTLSPLVARGSALVRTRMTKRNKKEKNICEIRRLLETPPPPHTSHPHSTNSCLCKSSLMILEF